MTVKFSEMCAVRTDLALKVEAAFHNYLEEIAQGYGAYLAPAVADGETELDARRQLVLLARKVQHHRQRIDRRDEGVLEQVQGDEKVRAELDRRSSAVDGKLRLVRSVYRGFYGLSNLARVGFDGELPRGAVRLHRYAVAVQTSLMSPDFDLEPLLDLGFESPEGENASIAARLANQLDPELSRLGELLDERHQASTKTLDLRLQRQEVIREFDYHIRGIVRMAQGMFRLAGRNDLGLRIRPILRRVLRNLDDQEAREQEAAGASEVTGAESVEAVTSGAENTETENTETEATAAASEDTAA